MIRRLIIPLLLVSAPASALQLLTYSSGTGFFVSRDGFVLTNNHVISHCKHFNVSGAVSLSNASLVAKDEAYDLALLKSDATPGDVAPLSSDKQPMKEGDPLVIVGFPGQSWQTGAPVTREAKVIDTKGPQGEAKWVQFSDALLRGNSGGPLLDQSGNVVGVVAAKAQIVTYNEAGAREETVSKSDIAISLPVLRKFLDDNSVRYQEADSGIYLSADHVTDNAKRYVVNVRCRYEDEGH